MHANWVRIFVAPASRRGLPTARENQKSRRDAGATKSNVRIALSAADERGKRDALATCFNSYCRGTRACALFVSRVLSRGCARHECLALCAGPAHVWRREIKIARHAE
jgi:hypothetical protein